MVLYHADQFDFYKQGDGTSATHENIPYKPNHKLLATQPFLNPEIIPPKSINLSALLPLSNLYLNSSSIY